MRHVFPSDYDAGICILIPIPCDLIPIIMGKIAELERRGAWASDADWEQGYQAVLEIEANMACGNIGESLDRLIKALGFAAGLPSDDPAYNAGDTLKNKLVSLESRVDQLETYSQAAVVSLGYEVAEEPVP